MADDFYPPTDDEPQQQPPSNFVPYQPEVQAQADQPPPNFVPYRPEPPANFIPYKPQAEAAPEPIKSAPAGATDEERRTIYGDEPLGTPSARGGLTPRQEDTPPILPTNKAGQTLPGYILRVLGEGLAALPERLTRSSGELQRQGDVYDPAPAVDVMQTIYGARVLGGAMRPRPIPPHAAEPGVTAGTPPAHTVPEPPAFRPPVTPEGQYQFPVDAEHQLGMPYRKPGRGEAPPRQLEMPLEGGAAGGTRQPSLLEGDLGKQGQTAGSEASAGVAQEPKPPAAEPVSDPHNKATLGDGQLEKGGEDLNTRDYGKMTPGETGASGVNVLKDGVDPTLAHTINPNATPPMGTAVPTADQATAAQARIAERKAGTVPLQDQPGLPPQREIPQVLDPKAASLLVNQPRLRRTEAAKRGVTPEVLHQQAMEVLERERATPMPERMADVPEGTLELPTLEVKPDTAVPPEAATQAAAQAAATRQPMARQDLVQREPVERGRSGRPIRTEPLPIGTEEAILEKGYERATGPKEAPREPGIQAQEPMRRVPRTPAEEKVLSRLAPEPGLLDNVPRTREEAASSWRKFYASSVNELDAIEQLKHRSLTDVAPEVDPGVLARLTRGLGKRVEQVLNDGTYDVKTRKITGDPLKTVTQKIEADPEGFMAYAMARTALERDALGVKTGIDIKAANQVIAQNGTKWGPVSNELNAWKNRMLDNGKDILGSKAIADIKNKYPGHIALHRMLDPASETGQSLGGGLQARNPLHRLGEGSEAPILNPLDSTIKDSVAILDMAERNRVGMAMEDLNNTLGPNAKFMREVKDTHPLHITAAEINKKLGVEGISEQVVDGMKVFRKDAFKPAEDRIRVFRDGKAKVYEVPEEIGRAFHAMDAQSMHMAIKIMGAPARMLRAGATLTPEFGLKNPLRDQIAAFTQTKYGYIPVYDFAVGLGNLFERGGKHTDLYQRWAIEGGGNANLVSLDRRLMYEDPKTVLQHVGNVVTTPYKMLQMMSELTENATRLGVYSRAVKRGAHPIEGAFEAREGTVDFQRIGGSMIQKVANALIPFYNVGWQGVDRTIRAFRDRPVQTSLTTAASITLPSVALWYLTKDDERIQQLPRWRKDVAWNFPGRDNWKPISTEGRNEILDGMGLRAEGLDLSKLTNTFRQAKDGSWQYNDAIIWALPKPPGIGQLFGSIPERMLDAYVKNNPNAFKELGKTVWQAFAPAIIPQVALPEIERFANKSFFLDRTLVSPTLQKLPASQQYGPQTSDTAKAIGDVVRKVTGEKSSLGSPIIIDNYIRNWTGGLGKHVTDMLDYGIFRAKDAPVKPSWSAADVPLLKGFVARFPSADAESIRQFYDTYDERKTAAAGIKNLQKKGLPEDPGLLRENPIQGIHNALGVGFKTVRNIMDNKEMSADDKRAAIDLTYLFMIEKAKQGNIALEESKRARTPPPNFIPYQPGVQ